MSETTREPESPGPGGPAHVTHQVTIPDDVPMVALLGRRDEVLRAIEKGFASVDVHVRGNVVTLTGPPGDVALAERLLDELGQVAASGQPLEADAVERAITILTAATTDRPAQVLTMNILSSRGRTIRPKTVGQKDYVEAIDRHTVVFGIGPAGTGKTYLAMAKAVQALQAKQVNRIVLTRPAVEAGESLGFLPGTLNDKIDPYLRPLYDALHDMIEPDSIPRLMAAGTIEVAPLAYMRGRAQPVDARVLTPEGFQPIGSLEVGDLVIGSNGLPTPVLGIYPQGVKQVYWVTTQDGASTRACGEHLWTVRTAGDKRRGTSRTLQTQDMVGNVWAGHTRRYELPMVEPVEFPAQEVPMDPYALGLLLGDGCITTSTTPSFSTADVELAEALEAALPGIELVRENSVDDVLRHVNGGRGGLRIANPVTVALREMGIAGARSSTKYVPQEYLMNSAAVRLQVLQGLLDADGGPVTQEGGTCRIQYTTISRRLCDDVVFLVESLGGSTYCRLREAQGRKPGRARGRDVPYRADAYVLDIRLPPGIQPFRLARKKAKYDATGGGRPMRFIDSILPAGLQETVCIQVAAEDSLYVTEDFLLTHNTLNDSFIILDEAQNTSAEQMKMFLTRLGFGSKIVVTGDVTQIDLPGGTVSGLRVVQEILTDIEDVEFCRLTSADVVRHRLVADIIDAYERWDVTQRGSDGRPQRQRRGESRAGRNP